MKLAFKFPLRWKYQTLHWFVENPHKASSSLWCILVAPKVALQICSRLGLTISETIFSCSMSLQISAVVFTLRVNQSKDKRFLVSPKQIKKPGSHPYLRGQQDGSPDSAAEPSSGNNPWDWKWRERAGKLGFNHLPQWDIVRLGSVKQWPSIGHNTIQKDNFASWSSGSWAPFQFALAVHNVCVTDYWA
jgi:hypothetical protein